MVSEGTTSYQGLVAQENAKVHAGHVYSSVTNSRCPAQHNPVCDMARRNVDAHF